MNHDSLKAELQAIADRLAELETRARELRNKNLADVLATAKGRASQVIGHADLAMICDNDPPQETDKPQEASKQPAPFVPPGIGLPGENPSPGVSLGNDVQE